MNYNRLEILNKFGFPNSLIKEYKNWFLLLRPKQVTLGALILVCKEDVFKYSEISKESTDEFPVIIKEVENFLSRVFSYDKINYLMLMMVDNIVHYHIIPRYSAKKNIFQISFIDYTWPEPPDMTRFNGISEAEFIKIKNRLSEEFNHNKNITKGYKIIYTTGAFDMLHSGHINILKKSKSLCDYLIVGLSTDKLIEEAKGRKPIIPFEDRLNTLQAIKYVDKVIPQMNKNKQEIVEKYKIDAITVGDDWKGKYPNVSCDLIYFPYTKEVSSTKLRENLYLNNNFPDSL
jgi:glycerol-3-phosphate cytidylyltransferase